MTGNTSARKRPNATRKSDPRDPVGAGRAAKAHFLGPAAPREPQYPFAGTSFRNDQIEVAAIAVFARFGGFDFSGGKPIGHAVPKSVPKSVPKNSMAWDGQK